MAGAFADQLIMIEILSESAPDGIFLYVKEHPRQRSKGTADRSKEFYERLSRLPNVRIIACDMSSFALREHCKAVATGTGTAGFEALFRGKPTLLFGHTFYQYAPGVFSIRTRKDCADAMEAIFRRKVTPDPAQVRLFVQAMEETCVPASVNEYHRGQASQTSFEDNTQAIASALLAKLRV